MAPTGALSQPTAVLVAPADIAIAPVDTLYGPQGVSLCFSFFLFLKSWRGRSSSVKRETEKKTHSLISKKKQVAYAPVKNDLTAAPDQFTSPGDR